MHNSHHRHIATKATIKNIVVAFVYVVIIIAIVMILFSSSISTAISLINMVSIETVDNTESTNDDISIDLEHNKLTTYPAYGTRYATIKIEDLGIDLPLYYGDTLSILKLGVGQSSGAYFPGEGGSIICMGHNTSGFLRELPNIELNAKIEIDTSYGTYTYTVYDTKIVYQTDVDELPIQHDEEILMLYTCYPVNSIGHAKNRFVVYAKLDS